MATEASSAGTVTVFGSMADSAEKESVGVTGGAEMRGVGSGPVATSSVWCEEGGAIAAPTITTTREQARSTSEATIQNLGPKVTRRRFITNPAAQYSVRASNRRRCSRLADSDTRDPVTYA